MESLNLLRYLIIRDKVTENQVRTGYPSWVFALFFVYIFFFAAICAQTGIWTELYKIEDTFTKPLRVGLNMTRAHYEKELQNTMEDKKAKTRGQSSFFFSSTTCIMNVKNTVIIAETGLF